MFKDKKLMAKFIIILNKKHPPKIILLILIKLLIMNTNKYQRRDQIQLVIVPKNFNYKEEKIINSRN